MNERDDNLTTVEDVKQLAHRLDNIERKDIAEMREDISDIKSELHGNKIIIEQNTKVMDDIKQEIMDITEKNQEYAKEILDIVNNFKQENRFETV